MDVAAFLEELRASPRYADQIVLVHEEPPRAARYAEPAAPLSAPARAMLESRGIAHLYCHQAQALDAVRAGQNALIVTGTASGKSLCYQLPLLELLAADPEARALLLFPTKALCQDQFQSFSRALKAAGLKGVLAGVYDGDTPSATRRRLRDHGAVIFTNPDMLHAGMMPQHGRWATFLSSLKLVVVDELHVYSGIFGSNAANLFTRFSRLCRHYSSQPQMIACSATIGNPQELVERLLGGPFTVIDDDGSPRGKRTYLFWNPPQVRERTYRSRRSANVEAHELMARLIERNVPTITFSKAKMTAEMIHRYVCETLTQTAPQLAGKVTPYRGGYRPEERRAIEARLFNGELLGVSTTRALELGIDIGGLEASIIVGYPGTLASYFQQAGRAGRTEADCLVILVGLDTSVNQYVMSHPEYLFGRPLERGVLDPHNPFVITGHLRCAAHELPLAKAEADRFGPHAEVTLSVLEENRKLTRLGDTWYHAATETPQHEVSLRDYADANVIIQDVDTGAALGELNKFDAPPILHPEAIYMHLGDTYRVLTLDLDRNLAFVKRVEVDYYTQPMGGTDVHHVDHRLREKPLGTGRAYFGEVTSHFTTWAYEKIHFYSLDAISVHKLDLPRFQLETMAFWIVPAEEHMEQVRRAGLDVHSGLRGIGYAVRMLLPLFMTCDTSDFSHSIGSANSEWNAIFIYERYPLGLGFTEKAYERLSEILPAAYDAIRTCPCEAGCPCCVGKPLRQETVWNVERGEASIPSKASALMILELLIGDGSDLNAPEAYVLSDSPEAVRGRVEQALRRRLERMREPELFHPIDPKPETKYPEVEPRESLSTPDVAVRAERRRDFTRELRKRLAQKKEVEGLDPLAPPVPSPPGMSKRGSSLPPGAFTKSGTEAAMSGAKGAPPVKPSPARTPNPESRTPISSGDSLASRARKMKRKPKDESQ